MNSPNVPHRPRKLVDYTKERGNHHLCANNNVTSTMTTTKPRPSHKHHSHKAIPSMLTISASNLDTTDTNYGCASEGPEHNDFLPKRQSPGTSRRQATSNLRERFQSSRSLTSFKRVTTVLENSTSSLDTTYYEPVSVEPIDFFLRVPARTQRLRSDLRKKDCKAPEGNP